MRLVRRLLVLPAALAYYVAQGAWVGLVDEQALFAGDLDEALRPFVAAAPVVALGAVVAMLVGGVLSVWVQVVAHEAGHAAAGVLLGLRVRRISLFGAAVLERGSPWPAGAGAHSVTADPSPDAVALPVRMALFHLAGPAANLALAAWLWSWSGDGPVVGEASTGAVLAGVAARAGAVAGLLLGVANLVPFRSRTGSRGPQTSDGLGMLAWLFRPGAHRDRLEHEARTRDVLDATGLARDLKRRDRPTDEAALRAALEEALRSGTPDDLGLPAIALAAASVEGGIVALQRNSALLARAAWHRGTPPEAAGIVASALALGETHTLVEGTGWRPLATRPDGSARYDRAERIEAAVALWQRALAAGTKDTVGATVWLAALLWLQGRHADVTELVRGVVLDGTAPPDVLRRAHLLRAAADAGQGDAAAAARSLRAAVALRPGASDGWGPPLLEDAVRQAVVAALPGEPLPDLARLLTPSDAQRWTEVAHEESVDVRIPPEAAWAFLASPQTATVLADAARAWTDPSTPAGQVGEIQCAEVTLADGGTRVSRWLVVELDPGRRAVAVGLDEEVLATSTCVLEPTSNGTRVRMRVSTSMPRAVAPKLSQQLHEAVRLQADRLVEHFAA